MGQQNGLNGRQFQQAAQIRQAPDMQQDDSDLDGPEASQMRAAQHAISEGLNWGRSRNRRVRARTGGLSDGDWAHDDNFGEASDSGLPLGSGTSYDAGARELGAMLVLERPPHARQPKHPPGPKRMQVSSPGLLFGVEVAL